jgi:predicted ATPase
MGTGISQVIPIVVAADCAKKDSLVMFEQPELHIHPRMQVELGDILISTIQSKSKENNAPVFLIETHSEHLILRLLRRIRETNDGELPAGFSSVTPDMLSVAYVQQNAENGIEIISLPVTPDGDFSRRWPNGFFAERAEELF